MENLVTFDESDTETVLQIISPYLEQIPDGDKEDFLKASILSWENVNPNRIMMPITWKMPEQ